MFWHVFKSNRKSVKHFCFTGRCQLHHQYTSKCTFII